MMKNKSFMVSAFDRLKTLENLIFSMEGIRIDMRAKMIELTHNGQLTTADYFKLAQDVQRSNHLLKNLEKHCKDFHITVLKRKPDKYLLNIGAIINGLNHRDQFVKREALQLINNEINKIKPVYGRMKKLYIQEPVAL